MSSSLEEKERERAFLNAIANNAPSLLSLIDETGRVADHATNIAFEQTLEYAPEETGGHLFWERYIDPAEADDVKAILERVFAGEVVGEHDHHWVTSTGRRLLIAWTCTALPSLDDRTLFLISGVDVTERVEREQEVQRRRDFLNAITRAVPELPHRRRAGRELRRGRRPTGRSARPSAGRKPSFAGRASSTS